MLCRVSSSSGRRGGAYPRAHPLVSPPMHCAVVHLPALLAVEKSKTAFYIAGGVLALWALVHLGRHRAEDARLPSQRGRAATGDLRQRAAGRRRHVHGRADLGGAGQPGRRQGGDRLRVRQARAGLGGRGRHRPGRQGDGQHPRAGRGPEWGTALRQADAQGAGRQGDDQLHQQLSLASRRDDRPGRQGGGRHSRARSAPRRSA